MGPRRLHVLYGLCLVSGIVSEPMLAILTGSYRTLDPLLMMLLPQVAELEVPYVLMHMRGTPATMQQPQHTQYAGDVCAAVGQELQDRCQAACQAGIAPWRLVLDPGECSLTEACEGCAAWQLQ